MAHPCDGLLAALTAGETAIAVIGLGYVGAPLARCLARRFRVLGYDINVERQSDMEDVPGLELVGEAGELAAARVFIIAVPTPIDQARQPDLRALLTASELVAEHLRPGSLVIYESTVYPGCCQEDCQPRLEQVSGLQAERDFALAYSPERINPGDDEHSIERVVKVVGADDEATRTCVAGIYGTVIEAGIHVCSSLRVAEAAKVIENVQRDLNIALVNEVALICHRLGIDTGEVLAAAGTKWNFLPFRPGLVGGHCIGVDPYYLTHRAQRAGHHPEVILAGRRINDGMGRWVARECLRELAATGRPLAGARILILGLAFKADCADHRNTRVVDLVEELWSFSCEPVVVDPLVDPAAVAADYGLELGHLDDLPPADALILAVPHAILRAIPFERLALLLPDGAPVFDLHGIFDRGQVEAAGLRLWRL